MPRIDRNLLICPLTLCRQHVFCRIMRPEGHGPPSGTLPRLTPFIERRPLSVLTPDQFCCDGLATANRCCSNPHSASGRAECADPLPGFFSKERPCLHGGNPHAAAQSTGGKLHVPPRFLADRVVCGLTATNDEFRLMNAAAKRLQDHVFLSRCSHARSGFPGTSANPANTEPDHTEAEQAQSRWFGNTRG